MEKFKNFVYDKSDLLVALLIIVVAALIIWLGISNIMKPYKAETKTPAAQTEASAEKDTKSAAAEPATPAATESNGKKEDVTAKAATIIIRPGENSDQIAEKLIVAGAITNKNTFYAKLEELGIASKIQEGTFEIPAGSSLEAVCKIITKTN